MSSKTRPRPRPKVPATASLRVQRIAAEETHPIRHIVLRAGLPPESAIFPGDEDSSTIHLGAFRKDGLVAVATLLRSHFIAMPHVLDAWQLRGMATLPHAQRRGAGTALLRACVAEVANAGGDVLWCNARVNAVPFYLGRGFMISGEEFDIPTAGPHRLMWMTTMR